MNPNHSPVTETEDGESLKKLKRDLKLMYLKHLELMKSQRKSACWPSISSITSTPSCGPSEISIRPNSAIPNEILTYSHNMRNVVKYLNDHVNVHTPICSSSVKNSETNEQKISESENAIMPPPSTTRVQKNRISMNKMNDSLTVNKQKLNEDQQMSVSDIFKTPEQEKSITKASNKTVYIFRNWTVMLTKEGKLIVKGKLPNDVTARSKPIRKKLGFKTLESLHRSLYNLEGNLADPKNELPLYVREKFINGFPDDWQNVVVLWKKYLAEKHKSSFRWPTPASDSDHDGETSECLNDEHNISIISMNSTQQNFVKENDKSETNNLSCSSSDPTNGMIQLLGKEKLIAFTQMLGNKNVSQEYADRFREMLISINAFVSLQECQKLLTGFAENDTKSRWDNSISILSDVSMSTPKKIINPLKIQAEEPKEEKVIKGGKRSDEDNESCLGVPKIPSNIFQNRPTSRRYSRRSRQAKRKLESEDDSINYGDDISIVTEYKAALTKNQLKNKIFNDENSIEKDSGCHTMSFKLKKRRYSGDYDGATSDMIDATMPIPERKADFKPSIVNVKNVNINLGKLQKPEEKSQIKNVASKIEEKERGNEELEEAVEKRKHGMKNDKKEQKNKENEKTDENTSPCMKNEEKKQENKKTEKIVEKTERYGLIDNPKVLKSWKPTLIYDPKLKNQCGLVLEGTLINEAGCVLSRKYQTDPLQRRITPKLVQTMNNTFFKLENMTSNLRNVPKPLHAILQNGLPSDFDDFFNRWKIIEDGNRSHNLDSSIKRQRRQSINYEFWKAANVEQEPISSNVAKKLFSEKDNGPKNSKEELSNKKKLEENKKVTESTRRLRPRQYPKCTYKKVSDHRDYAVQLSEDYSSLED